MTGNSRHVRWLKPATSAARMAASRRSTRASREPCPLYPRSGHRKRFFKCPLWAKGGH